MKSKLRGRIPWNKGLTKETDSRILLGSSKSNNSKKQPGGYYD